MIIVPESGNTKAMAYIVSQSQQVVVEEVGRYSSCVILVGIPYPESKGVDQTQLCCGAGGFGIPKLGKVARQSGIKLTDRVTG